MRRFPPPSKSRRLPAGFTLVEIALALGIVGFALVAIVGMVPVAVDNARESRLQTRAAFIGRAIFDGLLAGVDGTAVVQTRNSGNVSDFTLVPLTAGLSQVFILAFDEAGNLLTPPGSFDTGQGMPGGAAFVARLTLSKSDAAPALAELSVETPAGAAHANRRKYVFVSRLMP